MIRWTRCTWMLLMAASLAGVDDLPAFAECLGGGSARSAIVRDSIAAAVLGITVTPAIVVNEKMFEGYPGFDRLHEAVRQSLLAENDDQGSTGSDSQGVDPSRWRFTKLWQVGAATHDFMTSDNLEDADVDVDAEGNVYILSQEAMRVFVASESGELIDSIGRQGSGPGEFSNPGALDVADGILHVYDRDGGVSPDFSHSHR